MEFGVEIAISLTDAGFAYLDNLSWDPYYERGALKELVKAYRQRHGHYPKIIRAEEALAALDDQKRRHAGEGRFGQGERCFGLGLMREKMISASKCTITISS